tara:strand:+ start:235 stop:474 length:240 start_codon:yes stop_codon:yes gene_type:complete
MAINRKTQTIWTGEGSWERSKTVTVTTDGVSGWRVKVTEGWAEECDVCGVTNHWWATEQEAWNAVQDAVDEWCRKGWRE